MAKVAAISGETSTYIWHRMPYAVGLQFCTAWYQVHDIECERLAASRRPSLKVVI